MITAMMTPTVNRVLVKKGMISCGWKVSFASVSHLGKDTTSKVISGIETIFSFVSHLILTSVGMGNIIMSLNILLLDNCSEILIVGVLNFKPFGSMLLHLFLNEASPFPSISTVSSVYFSYSKNSLHLMNNLLDAP